MAYVRWLPALALLGLLFAAPTADAGPVLEIDYAKYDVRVTDTKGVVTESTDFGYRMGPNILMARRGDGLVEIPFRKIRMIEIGEYIPSKGYSPVTVTSRGGQRFQVELERIEARRYLSGDTELGNFRIRMGHIRRLEFVGLSHQPVN